MPQDYTVNSGDCMTSIAFEHGFFWETLWNHGQNQALKSLRKDPNILRAGDLVHIPDLILKEESGATEQRHKFKLKGVPAKLKLRLMRAKLKEAKKEPAAAGEGGGSGGFGDLASAVGDLTGGGGDVNSTGADPDYVPPKWEEEPIRNAPYVLEVDGAVVDQGMTDGEGCVEIPLINNAATGKLIVHRGKPEEKTITLGLGGMDPIDEPSGLRMRLKNLGYFCEAGGPMESPDLKDALRKFQERNAMEVTGVADGATRAKIQEVHGS